MKFINISRSIALSAAVIVALAGFTSLAAQGRPLSRDLSVRAAQPFPFKLGKVTGFADYHAHQMGQLGFGGRSMWGSHTGPEHIALRSCNGLNHAVSWLPVAATLIKQPDLGQHPLKPHGYHSSSSKRYKHWPVWQTTTHQGYWEGWLRQAHKDGMRLFVMSAVNFDMFCGILPKKNTNAEVLADLLANPADVTKQCDDMVNIKRQIRAAHAFAKKHWWYEIAKTPAEARSIIQQGKMAVILSVEASKIWGDRSDPRWSTVLSRLNTLESMGMRAFQITHQLDNNVAGSAIFHPVFSIFNTVDNLKNLIPSLLRGNFENYKRGVSKRKDSRGHNLNGLTSLGKQLVKELMRRKLIVDVAHLSQRSFNDVYNISRSSYKYYPLHVSHGHFRDMFSPNHTDEKKHGKEEIRKIIQTGGVFGLRTGPERVKTYKRSGVSNNCHGSSRSFAQSYMLAQTGYRLKIGFGIDMTGMIGQVRPRFFDSGSKWGGKIGLNSPVTWACGADIEKDGREEGKRAQGSRSNGLRNDYDLIGFAHVGHTKNLLRDLNKLGVQTHGLEDAAESYIAMWERIHSNNRRALYSNPNGNDIDHASYTRSCRRLFLVGPRAKQLGVYKWTSNYNGYGFPAYVPICQSFPDPTVQNHNCSGWGTKYGNLCIKKKSKDGKTFYAGRKIVEDKCPLPHSKVSGTKYNNKIVCLSNWDRTIQRRNCTGGGKFRWGNYCIVAQSSYHVRVRNIVRDKCPVPYRYARTHSNGKIICKPTPHFKLKSKKCSKKGGFRWSNYCLWNQGYWYKGRETK